SLFPALNAFLGRTGHYNDAVEAPAQSCLEQQGCLEQHNCLGLSASDFVHPLLILLDHAGMHDDVQFVDPWPPLIEGNFSQTSAVNAGIAIENLFSKPAHHF